MRGGDKGGSARTYAAALARDRARLAVASLPEQRTDAEWVTHPTALDDLLRVMGGTSIRAIDAERRLAKGAA